MGKKSKRTKRKSELKIIFFIILVAAALFIVSTYAWFSTQRNVSITNLSGTVEVAEGLEISLDAKRWFNEIVLGDGEEEMSIIDDAYEGQVLFSNGSWITAGGAFDAGSNKMLYCIDTSEEAAKTMQVEMSERVEEFTRINNLILETDYYKP